MAYNNYHHHPYYDQQQPPQPRYDADPRFVDPYQQYPTSSNHHHSASHSSESAYFDTAQPPTSMSHHNAQDNANWYYYNAAEPTSSHEKPVGATHNGGDGTFDSSYSPTENEKYANEHAYDSYGNGGGSGGYGAGAAGASGALVSSHGKTYTGNSIWAKEDKQAFRDRSGCGKIMGSLFCLSFFTAVTVASAVCFIFIFSRPPAIGLSGFSVPQPFLDSANSFVGLNLSVDYTIANPNSISATLKYLQADITSKNYKNITVGKGRVDNFKIESNANSTLHFPLNITLFDPKKDPNNLAFQDIGNQCGWTNGGAGTGGGNLSFDLKVKGRLSVLSLGVTIPFSQPITAPCPNLTSIIQLIGTITGNSDLANTIGNVVSGVGAIGNAIGGAISGLTGGGRRRGLIDSGAVPMAAEPFEAFLRDWIAGSAAKTALPGIVNHEAF